MYKLIYDMMGKPNTIQYGDKSIPLCPDNTDYQEFLTWNSEQAIPLDLNSTIEISTPQPPRSTILAKVKSIKITNPKKVIVTRTWNGQDYDVICRAVSQTIVDSYTAGNLIIGDWVLLTYCEHDYPDQPIITHKVVVL